MVRSASPSLCRRQTEQYSDPGGCAAEEPLNPIRIYRAARRWSVIPAASAWRGPQSSGILLGRQSLCKAAYFQAAPHHCYGPRPEMQQGRIHGLLAACGNGTTRPCREQRMWRGWMQTIENRLKSLRHQLRISGAPGSFQQGDTAACQMGCQCAEDHRHRTGRQAGCRYAAILIDAGSGGGPAKWQVRLPIMPI